MTKYVVIDRVYHADTAKTVQSMHPGSEIVESGGSMFVVWHVDKMPPQAIGRTILGKLPDGRWRPTCPSCGEVLGACEEDSDA